MPKARAKMRVTEVKVTAYAETVKLTCEYDEDNPEDLALSEATPCGEMNVQISNRNLWGKFRPGKFVYVDFSDA